MVFDSHLVGVAFMSVLCIMTHTTIVNHIVHCISYYFDVVYADYVLSPRKTPHAISLL
jgi:hypothetical protein